jgi:hypothetical protein
MCTDANDRGRSRPLGVRCDTPHSNLEIPVDMREHDDA